MAAVELDLDALQAEVSQMSEEDIRKALVEVRSKQRVQQKKYHNTESAKSYQKKRAAKIKLLAEAARKAGIYDAVLKEANEKADQILAEDAADAEPAEEGLEPVTE
jgi:hypothetical protein